MGFRAATVAFALGVAVSASAVTLQFKIQNNSGVNVDDVHLLISGTGNNITNRMVLKPGGGVIQASGGNEFNSKFNALLNGGFLVGQFDVPPGSIVLNSGYWTFGGVKVADINIPPNGNDGGIKVGSKGGDVEYFVPVPEPTSMAALGIGALALLRRRRKA
jgi:hypothetical protein